MNEKEQEITNALLELIWSNPSRTNCTELINSYRGIIAAAKERKEMEAWKPWRTMTGIDSAKICTGIRDNAPE